MRLTLRTLLAYLDDILAPEHAREIGRKVAESAPATSLVNRIREVMRRRRLTAPDLDGAQQGLSPNVVAEYLDNTLEPDGVADVERVCLESDVHLAEAAACHQVLTLVLGDPVEVTQDSRERMYLLGPVVESSQLQTPSVAERPPESPKPQPSSFNETIPEYLRRKPLWQRALPYAAVLTIAGVWFVLLGVDNPRIRALLNLPGPTKTETTTASSIADNDVEDVADALSPVPSPTITDTAIPGQAVAVLDSSEPSPAVVGTTPEKHVVPSIPEPGQTTTPTGDNDVSEPKPSSAVDPPPPADEVEPSKDDSPADVVRVIPDDPAPAKTTNTVASITKPVLPTIPDPSPSVPKTEAAKPTPQPVKPLPEPPPMPPVQYDSSDGILLRFDEPKNDWFVMPKRSMIHPGDRLASPNPFRTDISVANGQASVSLVGPTAVRLAGPSEAAAFGFQIKRGRLIIRNQSEKPLVVSILVNDELWRIELLTGETVCGIEITSREPEALEQDLGPETYTGSLYVPHGSVRFADGNNLVRVIEDRGFLTLSPADRKSTANVNPASLLTVPQWLESPSTGNVVQRKYAKQFEDEFTTDSGVKVSIPAVTGHARSGMAELAVGCLVLIDSYQPLVQTLAQSPHEEARREAFRGLRQWLPASPENGERLEQELRKHFRENDAAAIYALLWGYDASAAANAATSRTLVDWLMHDQIIVRELAFYHIFRLTGRKNSYRPLGPEGQRRSAAKRFMAQIEKDGGLIRN